MEIGNTVLYDSTMQELYNSLTDFTIDMRYVMNAEDCPAPNDGICLTFKRDTVYGWQIYLINNIEVNEGIYIRNWYQKNVPLGWKKINTLAI